MCQVNFGKIRHIFVKFGHLLANIVAHVEFALRGHHLVVLLVLERLLAQGIVAHNFATLGLVFLNLRQTNDCGTVTALDPKRVDDFFDDTRGTPNFDVKMANRAVLVHHKPILDAQLAEQLVAIVTLFRVTAHLCTTHSND